MIPTEVARRYARALFELAKEAGSVDKTVKEVSELAELYAGNDELARTLSRPMLALESKRAILTEIADRSGASAITKHALLLLGDRNRLAALPGIARSLRELADKDRGLVRAEVVSAIALPEAYYERLKVQLERVTGKKITFDKRIDDTMLGGVVARIGDRVFDGSLRSRLAEARQHLLTN